MAQTSQHQHGKLGDDEKCLQNSGLFPASGCLRAAHHSTARGGRYVQTCNISSQDVHFSVTLSQKAREDVFRHSEEANRERRRESQERGLQRKREVMKSLKTVKGSPGQPRHLEAWRSCPSGLEQREILKRPFDVLSTTSMGIS